MIPGSTILGIYKYNTFWYSSMYRYNNRSRLLGGRAGQCARGQAVLTRSLSYAMSINVLRPRLLRRTSSVALDYQPFLGYYNCRRFFFFSGSIPINRLFFLFSSYSFCSFCAHNEGRHKPSSDSHKSIYVPQAQQSILQSGLHRLAKYIYTAERSCGPKCDNASKQTRASQVLPRATMLCTQVCYVSCFPLC